MCLYPGGLGIRLGRKNLYVCETVITTELFFRIHRFIFFPNLLIFRLLFTLV